MNIYTVASHFKIKLSHNYPKNLKTKRHEISEMVLYHLSNMLGGEGWGDPRLVQIVENWIEWPIIGDDIDVIKEAESLVEISFDPRELVHF